MNWFGNRKNNITKEHYDLLSSVFYDLRHIVVKLRADEELVDILKIISEEDNLTTLLVQDIFQTIRIMKNGDWCSNDTEVISCLILFDAVSNEDDMYSFRQLSTMHTTSEFRAAMKQMEQIAMNPIFMNLSSEDATIEIKYNLSLIGILKFIESQSYEILSACLYRCANMIVKADMVVTAQETENLQKLYKVLQDPIEVVTNESIDNKNINITEFSDDISLDKIMEELDSLIGLTEIKNEVNTLVNLIKVQQTRKSMGMEIPTISHHMVFAGNPGTGKTTVARIIAKIYKALNILQEGQLIEADRSSLIGRYVGHTALKTNELINQSINGVLFIDEAYALAQGGEDDYGQEAIASLVKRMEDDRDKLVVICAGYTADMKMFIDMNSGLKSRFNKYLEFSDYLPSELVEIYTKRVTKLDYKLTNEAKDKLFDVMTNAYNNREQAFGNARYARNLFEKTLERQANRVAAIGSLTQDILCTIEATDIPD